MSDNPSSMLPIKVSGTTRYIISTSGRLSSLQRYQKLLQEVLKIDVAYIPISSDTIDKRIDPERFVWALRGLNSIGGAISRDIKHKVIPYLDEVEELAKEIQSVNTVIRRGNRLIGYNTDAYGFRHAIVNALQNSSKKVKSAVVYGYGGVSGVVFYVLKALGIKVFVTGRRIEMAKQRALEYDVSFFDGTQQPELFVNAAPVTNSPLEKAKNFMNALSGCTIVFDHEMPGMYLKKYCEAHKIQHISGKTMYYPQMYRQWELFLDGFVNTSKIPSLIAQAEKLAKSSKL